VPECLLVEDERSPIAHERERVACRVGLVDDGLGAEERRNGLDGDDDLLLRAEHAAVGRRHGVGHGPRNGSYRHAVHHVLLVLCLLGHLDLAFALLARSVLSLHAFLHAFLLGVLRLAFRFERIAPLLLFEQGTFLGIENPHRSFTLRVIFRDTRDLEEGLVKRQVVADRVLPPGLGVEAEPLPLACNPVTHFAERTAAAREVDERAVNDGRERRSGLERRGADERHAIQAEDLLRGRAGAGARRRDRDRTQDMPWTRGVLLEVRDVVRLGRPVGLVRRVAAHLVDGLGAGRL
jgi:hypothetical protein